MVKILWRTTIYRYRTKDKLKRVIFPIREKQEFTHIPTQNLKEPPIKSIFLLYSIDIYKLRAFVSILALAWRWRGAEGASAKRKHFSISTS
jgi:hypothetical protein